MVALLGIMVVAGVIAAGTATAQPTAPPDASANYGRGYVDLTTKNIDKLCPGGGATGVSGATEGTADPGLDGPIVGGADCDLSDPALWEAVDVCIDTDKKSEPDPAKLDEADFLECMATKGFGEQEEKVEKTDQSEQTVADLSLARLSSSLTSFYVNALSPLDTGTPSDSSESDGAEITKTTSVLDAWKPILTEPGNAGSFVGSPDRTKQESTGWLFSAADAANVSSVNYSAFNRDSGQAGDMAAGGQSTQAPDAGVEGYLLYGAMLSGMGFDTVMAADGGAAAGRSLSGLLMMAGYAGAGFVDVAFDSVVSVLQWTNPFRFMVDAITDNTDDTFTAGMEGSAQEPPGAFDGLREFFGTVYGAMVDLGWMVTIPMFIAMTVAGMLLMRKFDTSSKMKALAIRIAFLVVGLPLLGTSYTAGLDAMKGASGDAASAHATKVVLSTYVDFEAWVNGPRLQPPTSGQSKGEFWWNEDNDAPNGATAAVARKLALNINANNRPVWSTFTDANVSKDVAGGGTDSTWASSVSGRDDAGKRVDDSQGNDANVFTSTMELLNKFRSGDTVSAGAFESSVKAGLIQEMEKHKDTPEAREIIASWFQGLSSPEALSSMSANDVKKMHNPLIEVKPGASFQANRDPSNEYSVMTFGRGESSGACLNTTVVTAGWDGKADSEARTACNMSPLAMFNYLNTSFGPTSMDVYTPGQTTSSWAREAHASVTAIGTGPAQFMYWFSAMTMLASFTIIGLAYAMMMMISSIKRGIQLIAAVPFATLGFVAGIAKCVIYTAAMFLEILGTIFIYKVVQELIVVVPTILERPLAERLSDGVSESTAVAAAAGAAGVVSLAGENNLHTVVLIITAVSSAGLIMFTMMALKIRRSLLDGLDQAVTRLVNKFMDTQASGGMEPGQPSALRQGVARGAGMAATSTLIGGGAAGIGDGGGDLGGGSDGTGSDGGGVGTPGVPGAGDGAMSVGKDGELRDKAGNPVTDAAGQPLTAAEMMPIDAATGNVHDGTGAPILGEDGSPLNVDDVAGFDGQGRMLDKDGEVLTDAAGQELTSQPAAATSSRLAGDRAVASGVLSRGLSDFPTGTSGVAMSGATSPVSQPTVPVAEPSSGPRQVGGPLRSDVIANGGDSSIVGHAAALTASSMVTQRMAGPQRRKPPEAMGASGKNPGSSGNGSGGGSGPTGGSVPQRRSSSAGTAMQSAAMTAAVRNRQNDRDTDPPAQPPRGN
ncbi:hypothetical protein [Rhodococcus sp. NCIMB 12038]|uniref:hypothetical protein n=1 Tax=Rhodococcus sp. NCIMB 12038 TaxID=933800 RepID=UPI000B3D4F2C|nr:hypothetical protein [Rhodococcus sp. NCIMB 12038]OUS97220.1 hypothetical protein CA951_02425 [Rhodococcus sp. NCIMB 12038]